MSQESQRVGQRERTAPTQQRPGKLPGMSRWCTIHCAMRNLLPAPPPKNPQFNCILLGMSSEEPTPKRKPALEVRSKISHPGIFFFISLGFFSPLTASWFSHLNQLAVGNGVLSARHHITSSIHSIFLSLGSNKEAFHGLGYTGIPRRQIQAPKYVGHCLGFPLSLGSDVSISLSHHK